MEPGKRGNFRLFIQTPLAFKILRGKNLKEKSPSFNGMIKDLSTGGLQFGTNTLNHADLYIFNEFERMKDRNFKPNLLLVKFSLPGEGKPFVFCCQPRWSNQGDLVETFEFYIGARYIKSKRGDLARLQDYILTHGDYKELIKFDQQKTKERRKKKAEELQFQKYAAVTLPIRYQIISSTGEKRSRVVNAFTRNISVLGLCACVEDMDVDGLNMVFNETPLNRSTIKLEILIPNQRKITATGEVRWFERVPGGGKFNYNVGIKFLKTSENDMDVLGEFIKDKPDDVSGVIRRW